MNKFTKNLVRTLASIGWNIVDALVLAILKPLEIVLNPKATAFLKEQWGKIDKLIEDKIAKI